MVRSSEIVSVDLLTFGARVPCQPNHVLSGSVRVLGEFGLILACVRIGGG